MSTITTCIIALTIIQLLFCFYIACAFHQSTTSNGRIIHRAFIVSRQRFNPTKWRVTTAGLTVLSSHEQQQQTISSSINTKNSKKQIKDNRPFAARAPQPRQARRMNHSFRHLYRHLQPSSTSSSSASSNKHQTETSPQIYFLMNTMGYTRQQVDQMKLAFPPLLELSVERHLRPKFYFLTHTLNLSMEQIRQYVPPHYFGSRLERIIAPRHAFLQFKGLPHDGPSLLQQQQNGRNKNNKWQEFLVASRNAKHFCALCNQWQRQQQQSNITSSFQQQQHDITCQQIQAFDVLFQRGLMAAARNELVQANNSWPLDHINITSGELIQLLIQHGANPHERDSRGATLLHWAAGTGNLNGLKALLPHFHNDDGIDIKAERDGSTLLHWAAAGVDSHSFGIGGHVDICRFILLLNDEEKKKNHKKKIVNMLTKDGNSVLMWAAWSGSLDVVKLLVRNRADVSVTNRNGCTVAHWAASGGNLAVCKYLAETVRVDFNTPNYGGNTPLTHAVAFGRFEVAKWLQVNNKDDGDAALALAKDFVDWTPDNTQRKQILGLFQEDWYQTDQE